MLFCSSTNLSASLKPLEASFVTELQQVDLHFQLSNSLIEAGAGAARISQSKSSSNDHRKQGMQETINKTSFSSETWFLSNTFI